MTTSERFFLGSIGVGRRTSDVAMSGEVFYGWMDGMDKKRRKNSVLGSPINVDVQLYPLF